MTETHATVESAPDVLLGIIRRQLVRFGVVMCAANVLLPVFLVLYSNFIGKRYWYMFWGEGNAITWFSSVQLLAVALVAWANFHVAGLLRDRDGPVESPHRWIWAVFAAGFVFLSLDERFELHETIRDEVLIPRGMFDGIPFIRPGDIGLWVYLLVGAGLTVFLLREIRRHRAALAMFLIGVALAGATTTVDSLPRDIEPAYFWTSAFEEVGEIWAQLLFLLAFLLVVHSRLGRLAPRTGS